MATTKRKHRKHRMTAKGRAAISRAQKRRWAAWRAKRRAKQQRRRSA